MTDREREVREWCSRALDLPDIDWRVDAKRCARALLAVLDVERPYAQVFHGGIPEIEEPLVERYRDHLIDAAHAALFGSKDGPSP